MALAAGCRRDEGDPGIRDLRLDMAFPRWDMSQQWLRALGVGLVVLLLGAYALPSSRVEAPQEQPLPLELVALPDVQGRLSDLSLDGGALVLGVSEENRRARAELRFVLPPHTKESPHWVIWLRRVPAEAIKFRVGDVWVAPEHSFLMPETAEGPMPVGYLVRLPNTWEGEIRVEMSARGLRMVGLRPEIISEALADRYLQQATILASIAYASLFTLALMGLALFFASRDLSFLSFFSFCLSALFLLSVFNGHIYLFDNYGLLRQLGGAGLHAVALLFEVVSFRILLRYIDARDLQPAWTKAVDNTCTLLLLAAGLLLAWRERLDGVATWLMPGLWMTGCLVALLMLIEALRRKVPFSGAVFLSVLVLAVSILSWELASRGVIAGGLWTTYGYQLAIVLCASMIGVGLISRISKYREQRDREQLARADSERRMYREAVRSELLTALQMGLRGAGAEDIQPMATRLLLDHLRRIVPVDNALVIIRGYHGRDTVAANPGSALDALVENISPRLPLLRQKLAINIDVQQPVARTGDATPVAIEAAVSLPVRAPSWGALVLERNGATVFHPDELKIARELARIAVLQIDEAFTAMQLRHTAEVDALTGTFNRRSLDQALVRIFHEGHREQVPASVLFVDIDNFKSINDRLGHACGDHCLREIAKTVRGELGHEDIFGRYGGEEFLIILPARQTEMARAIAEQIRGAVERMELQYEQQPLTMTVSIGVAIQLLGEAQPQPAVERADKALYAAKRLGRNRVKVAPAVFSARPGKT
jgi:diguanylate cyclase (GGDEF)-like protein